ncbi:MAG: Hpt domain-containing protein [Rubritepida sp.]|nr:Hpt domain-containing protein [Rubritepida sp.]
MKATIPPAVARLCGDELCIRVPQLRDAVGQRQRSVARDHAHALRGMAANFGLSGLALALATLESMAMDPSAPLGPAFAAVEREVMPALTALGYAA